jgi:hypothetical protein
MAEAREEKDVDMGNTVILTVYLPLVIVGMALVIMWAMSAAGSRRATCRKHEEEEARRDSIKREAFFIMGSSAIHVGELPFEGKVSR